MNANCFDIGEIQAFLDGELAKDESSRLSRHIDECHTCSALLSEAEDESALVFHALEREFNTLVPTHRLWNKINDSISAEHDGMPFWQKGWAFLSVALANPSFAVAAGVLIVIGIAAILITRTPPQVTDNGTARISSSVSVQSTKNTTVPPTSSNSEVTIVQRNEAPIRFEQAAYRAGDRRTVTATYRTAANSVSDSYMPGEESYVKTISSLTKSVEGQKDSIMGASERIAYERDMAVVNDAIAKMRNAVKKNPRNESAKQVLYSSYQNKIDLLNSASRKEELMASLK
ncbi:MAG: anti-sigma factor family protein [Pyrinomonadaceae bacterium]